MAAGPLDSREAALSPDILTGLQWLFQISTPIRTLNRVLADEYRLNSKALFTEFWAAPIALTIVVNAIVLHALNIDYKDPSFAAIYLISVSVKIFIGAIGLYVLCKIFGVHATVPDATSVYSLVVIYTPLMTALNVNSTYETYKMIMDVKAQQLGLFASWQYIATHLEAISSVIRSNYYDIVAINLREHLTIPNDGRIYGGGANTEIW